MSSPATSLPAAVMNVWLHARMREHDLSLLGLGKLYADRYGCSIETAARSLQRIGHQAYVTVPIADQLAVLFGEHPAHIFGEAWWSACEALDVYAKSRHGRADVRARRRARKAAAA